MRQRIQLMAAPPAIQPGGYVAKAYSGHTSPQTSWLDVSVDSRGAGWEIVLAWKCDEPVTDTSRDVDRFADAAAILAPSVEGAPLITMGTGDAGVDGWYWRSDRDGGLRIHANGLGTSERSELPGGATVTALRSEDGWGLRFELPEWSSLDRSRQIGFAVWRGAASERAGLKAVSPSWLPLP